LNHRNLSLRLFEFGKAYNTTGPGEYQENEKLCIVITGNKNEDHWKAKGISSDLYYLKSVVDAVLKLIGIKPDEAVSMDVPKLVNHQVYKWNGNIIAGFGQASKQSLAQFSIKQPVYFAGLNWAYLSELATTQKKIISELPRYPAVQRDLALVLPSQLAYGEVERSVQKIRLNKLREVQLFDIFESEKLGAGKKSMAVSFTFQDNEKTLTDKEIDGWMSKIMTTLEKDLQAEIRK
jgi:phenylalanyl-tRNA synthetase beta chain